MTPIHVAHTIWSKVKPNAVLPVSMNKYFEKSDNQRKLMKIFNDKTFTAQEFINNLVACTLKAQLCGS